MSTGVSMVVSYEHGPLSPVREPLIPETQHQRQPIDNAASVQETTLQSDRVDISGERQAEISTAFVSRGNETPAVDSSARIYTRESVGASLMESTQDPAAIVVKQTEAEGVAESHAPQVQLPQMMRSGVEQYAAIESQHSTGAVDASLSIMV